MHDIRSVICRVGTHPSIFSATQQFRRIPMPEIVVSTMSPAARRGNCPSSGVGVPVRITSPARSVTNAETKETSSGTPIRSSAVEDCPFSAHWQTGRVGQNDVVVRSHNRAGKLAEDHRHARSRSGRRRIIRHDPEDRTGSRHRGAELRRTQSSPGAGDDRGAEFHSRRPMSLHHCRRIGRQCAF